MSNDNHSDTITLTAQDVLAAIGFEAQRIAAAVNRHAAGYPFPAPAELQQVIDRMTELNRSLMQFSGASPVSHSFAAAASMGVELDVVPGGIAAPKTEDA